MPLINLNEITAFHWIGAENPDEAKLVFRVEDTRGARFVVKCDRIGTSKHQTPELVQQCRLSYEFVTALHQEVSKGRYYDIPQQESLNQSQINTFKLRLFEHAKASSGTEAWDPDLVKYLDGLLFDDVGVEVWYVMEWVDNLEILEDLDPAWMQLFSIAANWKKLGYMLATDMFFGNSDRPRVYDMNAAGKIVYDADPIAPQNTFLRGTNLVGLDLMNSNGPYVDLYSDEAPLSDLNPVWAGYLFGNGGNDERDHYAHHLVEYIMQMLKPAQAPAPKEILSFEKELRIGLTSGIAAVRVKAAKLAKQKRFLGPDGQAPQQIDNRLRAISGK